MHTQLILTTAPSAYSYHEFHNFKTSDLPKSGFFSMSWPTPEEIEDLENYKPNFDHFLWGHDHMAVNSRNIDDWCCITVRHTDPARLAYLVEYQVGRIQSGCYAYYVDSPQWVDDDTLVVADYL